MVLASAIAMILAATPAGAAVPKLVSAIASKSAIGGAADQIADEDVSPIGQASRSCWRRVRATAAAAGRKLPVTRSRPSSTMRMRPTGKISAPTSGWSVCTAPVMARLVAAARIATGERAANEQIGRRQRELAAPGFDHGAGDVDWLHIVHFSTPCLAVAEIGAHYIPAGRSVIRAAKQQGACQPMTC